MGDLYKVNFRNKVVQSKNGKKVGFGQRTRVGRKLHKMNRASSHEKIFHGAVIAGSGIDYLNNRHAGLKRHQAAAVSGVGAGIMLSTHHAARAAGAGWKTGVAVDVASSLASGYAQDRLRKHYSAQNRSSSIGHRRLRR